MKLAALLCAVLAGCAAERYADRGGHVAPDSLVRWCAHYALTGPHMGWVRGNPAVFLQQERVDRAMEACMAQRGYARVWE